MCKLHPPHLTCLLSGEYDIVPWKYVSGHEWNKIPELCVGMKRTLGGINITVTYEW